MGFLNSKKRVGVIRGGPSPEYELSLKTGKRILSLNIPGCKWVDVFIDRHGVWHLDGLARRPSSVLNNLDAVFNALHGNYGEDGGIQDILETFGVPYTGSGKLSSALAMRKDMSLKYCGDSGVQTPLSFLIREGDTYKDASLFSQKIPFPQVIKPAASGSSEGIRIISSDEEFEEAINHAFKFSSAVLVQEFVEGKEATCGVIDGLRGYDHYPLFPVEMLLNFSERFDTEKGEAEKEFGRCPGNFSREESFRLQELAVLIHQTLGLRHYSRSDFVVNSEKGIFFLEVNALPALAERSPFSLELEASGITFDEFIFTLFDDLDL
ncbi:MAG: ATP-grasp domain-containing protein [Candidatus Paceibacterota bacterium]